MCVYTYILYEQINNPPIFFDWWRTLCKPIKCVQIGNQNPAPFFFSNPIERAHRGDRNPNRPQNNTYALFLPLTLSIMPCTSRKNALAETPRVFWGYSMQPWCPVCSSQNCNPGRVRMLVYPLCIYFPPWIDIDASWLNHLVCCVPVHLHCSPPRHITCCQTPAVTISTPRNARKTAKLGCWLTSIAPPFLTRKLSFGSVQDLVQF